MLGMQDATIAIAWFLSLGSAIVCVVYGAIKWNQGGDE